MLGVGGKFVLRRLMAGMLVLLDRAERAVEAYKAGLGSHKGTPAAGYGGSWPTP